MGGVGEGIGKGAIIGDGVGDGVSDGIGLWQIVADCPAWLPYYSNTSVLVLHFNNIKT